MCGAATCHASHRSNRFTCAGNHSISFDTIIAGRTRVQTTYAVPKPLPVEQADAID